MFTRKLQKPRVHFQLCVELPTGELVELHKISPTMKVSDFKLHIEKQFGIPSNLQRLSYLDSVDLPDHTNLQHSDIVSGATIRLSTWSNWHTLLCASLRGDTRSVIANGNVSGATTWHKKRAWTALYIAAHWGHFDILLRMLGSGCVSVNEMAPSGRTALHAAAYRGNWKCLCVLLEKGADITVTDKSGCSALDLAKSQTGPSCKQCEKSLTFCAWNLQKKAIEERERGVVPSIEKLRDDGERRAHQFADSSLSTWLHGPQSQMYMSHPPNPFPCHLKKDKKKKSVSFVKSGTTPRRQQSDWFDPDRAMDFVPSGRDLMIYSESALQQKKHKPVRVVLSPSSLRPPSLTPSPLMFGRRSAASRSDSEGRYSSSCESSEGLDFQSWLVRKRSQWEIEIAESKQRQKELEKKVRIHKAGREKDAEEVYKQWMEKKQAEPKPKQEKEISRAEELRSKARHLTAVR